MLLVFSWEHLVEEVTWRWMTWSTSLWVCVHDTPTPSSMCEMSTATGEDTSQFSLAVFVLKMLIQLYPGGPSGNICTPLVNLGLCTGFCMQYLSSVACPQITATEKPMGSVLLDRTLGWRLAKLASTSEEGTLCPASGGWAVLDWLLGFYQVDH